ncbi:M16 family metallopeptidase [Sphingomonas mesophila]|uniref:M16 family metallopeptidase n=1 Tax=Sphingomonas mesophila TaxID=2303576 RepID=UPI000E57B8B0|nr:pitrilysin family protein [Sphingomonas mesophila]
MPSPLRLSFLLAAAAPLALVSTAQAQSSAVAVKPTPVPQLISRVRIPHSEFKLANGLTVLVHEDRKAPVVGVAMWYNVGSKDEPRGKTGFAHLFEHLMFNGSENLPDDFFKYLQQIGATDYNGTTNFDRTNYFQTVPKGALERVLFMESDRMGHLLGAVSQSVLDNQRGVVQNEKRQGDNQPGGLVFYEVLKALFPEGHPYRHSPIGSMADLDSASLADVRQWFVDNYGPNNAVLVLAGDINAAEARPLVQKYFGHIKRGPVNVPAQAAIPTLKADRRMVMKDRVAATSVARYWPMPGLLDRQLVALDVGGSILGGLASSRLDEVLVRNEKIATSVSAGLYPFQRVGIFFTQATVKPGVDPALVERRVNEILAEFIAKGPSAAEVKRAATSEVGGRIRGLESVGGFGGKAVTLAEGETFTGDSNFYARTLANYATVTPAEVQRAMRQWLTRPAFTLQLEPGDRPAYEEAKAVAATTAAKDSAAAPKGQPRPIPPLGQLAGLDFPDITNTRLSNGIEVEYAQRSAVPVTQVAVSFDAGDAADPANRRGLQSFTMAMLDEGTSTMSSQQLAEARETLGANINATGSIDRSTVYLSALSPNLAPSLSLLGATIKDAAFAPAEIERLRTQTLTAIAQAKKDPSGIGQRLLPSLLFGADHPYAVVRGGDEAAVKAMTRDELLAFRAAWLRPDNAKIYVVSDKPRAQVMPLLEAEFGRWTTSGTKGVKQFAAVPPRPSSPRIVLVDRPQSPQSVILAGQVTPVDPKSAVEALGSANDVLGGNFLSRINMDLRETKGWSYGVRGSAQLQERAVPYIISAPVQADRTGDSIVALNEQLSGFLGAKGVTAEEQERTIANRINALPGQFETSEAVLGAMMSNDLYGRPDSYYETLAARYRTLTAADLDKAIRGAVDPKGFVWVVVGDAAKIRPQLEKLGYPIEVVQPR